MSRSAHEPELELELELEPSAFASADGAAPLVVDSAAWQFEIPAGRRNTASAAELEYKATA